MLTFPWHIVSAGFLPFSRRNSRIVITGFNTDIEFEGVTYHVQTEDKGLSKPIILSLVYDRGTILASKRAPYDDLIGDGFDETVLAERLQKQHRLICAAVQSGRIDDLKNLSVKDAKKTRGVSVATAGETIATIESENLSIEPSAVPHPDLPLSEAPIPKPELEEETDLGLKYSDAEPLVDVISILDDDIILPDEAVEIVSDMAGKDRPSNNKLSIEFLSDSKFKGGERKTVMVMVCRGSQRKVVANAQIMVKILGSTFRPLIFHSATDDNGIAKVNLQLPNFTDGRAAFLVRAMAEGEEIELRRAIAHG